MRVMKDSGIAWIGEIPENWKMVQVRYLFRIGRGRVISQTELQDNGIYPVFSSQTKDNGCLGYINTYDFDISQLTWTTDGANAGTVFLRSGKHNCTNVCGTLQPLNAEIDLRFQKYALEHIAYYHKRADTNGFKIMNNEMANIYTILPPLNTQRRIADYLDRKCSQIDAIIDRQQEVIEKLKAYKLSVITEAVTKGLNPHVPMKDSGVEWIGEIPEHWKLAKLKKYCHPQTGITPSTSNAEWFDGEVQWFTPGDFNGNYHLVKSKRTLSTKALESSVAVVVPANTVMIICIGATAGKVGLADVECSFNQQITALLTNSLNPKFLMYWMIANTKFIRETALFTTLPILNNQTIGDYLLLFPANEDEEKQIVDFLDEKCNKIDSTITARENVINKLSEYKKSLIYEVVTGKKEV